MTGRSWDWDWNWDWEWDSHNWPTSAALTLALCRMQNAECWMRIWGCIKELHFHAFGATWSAKPHLRTRCWELKMSELRDCLAIKKQKFASLRCKFSYLFASSNFQDCAQCVVCACVWLCVTANFCIEESVIYHKKQWDTPGSTLQLKDNKQKILSGPHLCDKGAQIMSLKCEASWRLF